MRLAVVTAIVLALATLTAAPSLAAPAPRGTGGGQSGATTVGGVALDGSATGSADMGTFSVNDTNRSSYTADLDCVRVDGSTTYFSGVIRIASRIARSVYGITPGFSYVYGELFDGGEPSEDSFTVMVINPDGSEDPAQYCETDRSGSSMTLTEGNLQVRN